MKTFKWNKNTCVYGNKNQIGNCLFDHWSVKHFYFTGLVYIVIHDLLKIKSINNALYLTIFVTILHSIEEYLGNTSKYSIEGLVYDYIGPLLNHNLNTKDRTLDNDYIQNSLGDIISGIISCILIIIYWNKYKQLPYVYLYGLIPICIDLYIFIKNEPTYKE